MGISSSSHRSRRSENINKFRRLNLKRLDFRARATLKTVIQRAEDRVLRESKLQIVTPVEVRTSLPNSNTKVHRCRHQTKALAAAASASTTLISIIRGKLQAALDMNTNPSKSWRARLTSRNSSAGAWKPLASSHFSLRLPNRQRLRHACLSYSRRPLNLIRRCSLSNKQRPRNRRSNSTHTLESFFE